MRFELIWYGNQGVFFYRVCQGHTLPHIQDKETLELLTEVDWPSHFKLNEVVHGMVPKLQTSIEEYGLVAGGCDSPSWHKVRLHIHLCSHYGYDHLHSYPSSHAGLHYPLDIIQRCNFDSWGK